MSWGIVATAAVGVIGGAMSADAAGDAAEGQERAASEANRLQRDMYDQNVALAAPALNAGNSARDRLSFLLGLSGKGFSGTGAQGGGGSNRLNTYDQLRAQMLGQYTRQGMSGNGTPQGTNQLGATGDIAQAAAGPYDPYMDQGNYRAIRTSTDNPGGGEGFSNVYTGPQATTTVDEAGLDTAIRARLAEQEAEEKAREEAARNDPDFGRLANGFEFDKFSYTGEDLYKDPSYQFRLEQGQKAVDRQGAASGRFLSGSQLQASSNYNQGAASQEFSAAYGRAANTFQTNEGNRYNAYQTNFTNTVNPLLALSGAGQVAGAQLMNTNTNYAGTVGNNLMGAANAQGAAGIAGANAMNQGLSSGVNAYQTNQLLNRFGGVNNNPGISAGNQASYEAIGNSNNWWGTS